MKSHDNATKAQLLKEINELKARVFVLEKSEMQSSVWIENSPVCTKIVDLELNLQYMSKAGVRALKIDDITQLYGKPYPFHFYPGPFEILMADKMKEVKETGKIVSQEVAILDMEGNELWFHSTFVPVLDHEGKLDYIMIVSMEITKRIQAEKEIVDTKLLYEGITEGVQDGIWVTDENDVIFYANSAMATIAGISQEQIKGNNVLKDFAEETVGDLIAYYKKAKEERKPKWYSIRVTTPVGRDTWQDGWLIPQYKDKVFSGVICTIRDVTDAHLAAAKLQQSEETHRNLLHGLDSGVVVHAPDTSITFSNLKANELLGLSADNIEETMALDPRWSFLCDDNNKMIESQYPVNRVLSTGEPLRNTVVGVRRFPRGDVIWLLVNGFLVPDDSGKPKEVVITFADITERKKAEDELSRYREQLEDIVAARTRELELKNKELEKFNKLFIGREFRIKELREQVKELEKQLHMR